VPLEDRPINELNAAELRELLEREGTYPLHVIKPRFTNGDTEQKGSTRREEGARLHQIGKRQVGDWDRDQT
jgi:hypothetical protein